MLRLICIVESVDPELGPTAMSQERCEPLPNGSRSRNESFRRCHREVRLVEGQSSVFADLGGRLDGEAESCRMFRASWHALKASGIVPWFWCHTYLAKVGKILWSLVPVKFRSVNHRMCGVAKSIAFFLLAESDQTSNAFLDLSSTRKPPMM